jgi:hypothetical protein
MIDRRTIGKDLEGTVELLSWHLAAGTEKHTEILSQGSRCPDRELTYRLSHICLPCYTYIDRLCGLVVRVPGYRSRGPGFDSRRYQIF